MQDRLGDSHFDWVFRELKNLPNFACDLNCMMRQGEYHQKSLLWNSAEKIPGEEFGEVEEKVLRTIPG